MKNYTHVLYHGNCYDGFGAAWVAWRWHLPGPPGRPGDPTFMPVLYGHDPPDLPEDARVLILDFSYPRDVLLAMRERVAHLQVIDHHKTAQEDLAGLDFATFDLEHSGAYLAWQHFYGDTLIDVPRFILYLEDRDLWRFALPGSKGVSQALRAYPFDFEVWTELVFNVERLFREGPVVERFTEQMVALMCEHARIIDVGGYDVPVANATVFFSEVGDELCRRFPDAPFAAYYLDREDGLRQWGLRSRNGFDTSVVAKALGGGGHPAASGFQTPLGATL